MKRDLKKLALLGLTGGLLVGQQNNVQAASNPNFQETPWQTLEQNKCKNGCQSLRASCGGGRCGGLRAKCGGRSCGGLRAKCGGGRCGGLVADNEETKKEEFQSPDQNPNQSSNPNDGNMRYHLMTEQELLLELNANGNKMYLSLDDQGKALARRVASMMCQHTNDCKGLNGCMTAKNSCAGKGGCKGQGKCAISDKNLAVKLVYDKMATKRANMLN